MKTIVLISCASKKESTKMKAKDLYISPLFKKSLEYAHSFNPDHIYILSAKHHLLSLDEEIEPYNLSLNNMSNIERNKWGKNVINQLDGVVDIKNTLFVILAGQNYLTPIKDSLKHIETPLHGRIGERLQFLNKNLTDIDRKTSKVIL